MPKEQKERWKKCNCGIITDIDEECCPQRSLKDNPHKLETVELDKEEIKKLCKEKKIWTKYLADLERRFLR